jgi:hypothetical protein
VGVVGEDVEDHRRAVDHRDAQLLLQVAFLARHQLVVAGNQVGVGGRDLAPELGQLSPAQIAIGIGVSPRLGQLARRGDPGRAQKLLQLGEGGLPALPIANESDRQRALAGPRVDHACRAAPISALVQASVTASLHSPDGRGSASGPG